MVATVAAATGFLVWATSGRGLVPSRAQSVAEMSYEFVANTLRDAAGTAGMKFFPLVFSLFMFVLVANLFGMFPYFFTVTSHIIVTFALAMLVIGLVIVYGFCQARLQIPRTVRAAWRTRPAGAAGRGDRGDFLPVAADQPFGSSFRQHAGRPHHAQGLRGLRDEPHGALGALGIGGAILPLAMTVALTGLEFLVAFLQAYVFAVLTCMYLNDALHPGH